MPWSHKIQGADLQMQHLGFINHATVVVSKTATTVLIGQSYWDFMSLKFGNII